MKAEPVETLPKNTKGERRWGYEPKMDGHRLQVTKHSDDDIRARTRNDLKPIISVSEVARQANNIQALDAILDGEGAALDASGRTSWEAIEQRSAGGDCFLRSIFCIATAAVCCKNLCISALLAPPEDVTSGDVFDHRDKRAKSSITQANREKSCPSSVFTTCVGWKLRKDNPCVKFPNCTKQNRDRYVFRSRVPRCLQPLRGNDSELGEMMQCAMDLATVMGQHEDDILKLPFRDVASTRQKGLCSDQASRSGAIHAAATSSRHPRWSSSCGHPSFMP